MPRASVAHAGRRKIAVTEAVPLQMSERSLSSTSSRDSPLPASVAVPGTGSSEELAAATWPPPVAVWRRQLWRGQQLRCRQQLRGFE